MNEGHRDAWVRELASLNDRMGDRDSATNGLRLVDGLSPTRADFNTPVSLAASGGVVAGGEVDAGGGAGGEMGGGGGFGGGGAGGCAEGGDDGVDSDLGELLDEEEDFPVDAWAGVQQCRKLAAVGRRRLWESACVQA